MQSMPKYKHQLSKTALRLFIKNFEVWGTSKELNDESAKISLLLAFHNMTAQQYVLIHHDQITDPRISWAELIKDFLANCPVDIEEPSNIFNILGKQQSSTEKASIYIQSLRYLLDDNFQSMTNLS